MELLEMIKSNLINCGYALLLFLCAYLSNMAFSLYYNIGLEGQVFDKSKMLLSLIKAVIFIIGLSLLVATITAIPYFAKIVSWEIPEEFTELFSGLVIISTVMYVTARYAMEAFSKFKAILDYNE